MMRTRQGSSSLTSTLSSSSSSSSVDEAVCYRCPLTGFDGCKNGVNKAGFKEGSLLIHLKDQHYPNEEKIALCRGRLCDYRVYKAFEEVLQQTRRWLCTDCLRLHKWRIPCIYHQGGEIQRPFNGKSADFLIHGIPCPASPSVSLAADELVADSPPCLSLDLLDKVLQQNITTVASVPAKCKLAFARAFNTAIQRVISSPSDTTLWIKLMLFPICVLRIYIPEEEVQSGKRKRAQIAAINSALSKWAEPDGCSVLICQALEEQVALRELRKDKKNNQDKRNQEATNIRLCRKKLSYGMYTAAIRTLTSGGVAPANSATLEELQHKHPYAIPPTISAAPLAPALVATKELVLGRIRSFPKGTSCGRDGL